MHALARASFSSLLLALAACGGSNESSGPSARDASTSGPDASVDAGREDPLDASPDAELDAAPVVVDASSDAAGDASTDGAAGLPGSLRARVCGERTAWPSPLPGPSVTATRVGDQAYRFLEGPVWIESTGTLLFSDIDMGGDPSKGPPSRIEQLTPPAAYASFVESAGSNGLALFSAQTVIAATHDTRSLSFFALDGTRANIAITYDGKAFNSPNDVAVRSDGTVYFTDPDWQLGTRTAELGFTGVYSVKLESPPTGPYSATLIDDSLRRPNGIALSPDERTLYVGSQDREIWQYDVAADGSVSNRRMFVRLDGGSDGLTVDCAGNLYVTSGGVLVFSPDGSKLGEVAVAEGTANVAFGGADHQTLYITARTHLYAVDLQVPGWPY